MNWQRLSGCYAVMTYWRTCRSPSFPDFPVFKDPDLVIWLVFFIPFFICVIVGAGNAVNVETMAWMVWPLFLL